MDLCEVLAHPRRSWLQKVLNAETAWRRWDSPVNTLNGACAEVGAGQRVSHSTYQKLTQRSELVTSNLVKSLVSCAIPVVAGICRMWWC